MEYLYKLSFANQKEWLKVKESLAIGEEEEKTYPFYAFHEIGHVPIPAIYDEETEEEIQKASFHKDWAVDALSKVKIPELDKYVIENKKYYHNFNGAKDLIIIKPLPIIPDESWTVINIKAWLDSKDIYYKSTLLKADLLKLVNDYIFK